MIVTTKYYLYNSQDLSQLDSLLNISGKIYNHCIALHKKYYKLYNKHLNIYQLQKHLTKLKKLDKYEYWNQLGSQAIQQLTKRIEEAYKKFFDYKKGKTSRKTGTPTFKKSIEYPSFTFKGEVGYKLDGNRITINKKTYKFSKHRELDEDSIKSCTIKREKSCRFYVIISYEDKKSYNLPHTGHAVGIDFGLKTFLTLSDKNEDPVKSPEFLKLSLKKIQKANRELSRKQKGSNNRKKAKIKLAKLHERLVNQRNDYQWNLANELISKYDVIKIEDLNLEGMKKLWGRKVSDLAFHSFILKLEYLCKKYNKQLIKIDRFYPSSQLCSNCGTINIQMKDLKRRTLNCIACNFVEDRDYNASINIERWEESVVPSKNKTSLEASYESVSN